MSWDFFLAAGADDLPVEGIRKGTIAEWRGATKTDFGPAIDPLNNLADVRFHTDFDYPRFTGKVTSRDPGMSPVTVAATGEDGNIDRVDILFAHGRDPAPLLFGLIEIDGYKQPLAGSMAPLKGGSTSQPNWRICELAWDAINVGLRTRGGIAPAMTIHWEVFILAEAFQVRSEGENLFYFDPDEINGEALGKVSTEYRFMSEAPGAGDIRLLGGLETVVMAVEGSHPVLRGSDGATSYATHSVNSLTATASHAVTGTEVDL
ncbi:hypothetical protein [Hoeflea sp.]|uniref:hypothetical protein n=1 Tax=Hoeflea sp. TaxID=1940281 RepID=UPI00199F4650|nr:hypothetical protein [Hoeflea sp.]MBC7282683.1 hypothetical protein [Hoeflea sp.]